MCDYSLYHFPNRLAQEGEDLIAQRFSSGCIGFASPSGRRAGFGPLKALRSWLLPRLRRGATAVCIPPGSHLLLSGIPASFREECGLAESEQVTFIQVDVEAFRYRDAIELADGRRISVQALLPGQRVHVLSLSSDRVEEYVGEAQLANYC